MIEFIGFAIIAYAAIGVYFVTSSKSRGLFADILFGVFWLFYLIRDRDDVA